MDERRVRREIIDVATIRASCPSCGDVELTTKDVSVQVCSANNQGSYSFLCPVCRLAVSKQAEARIVDLLVSSGVRLAVWHLPAELEEARQGPPISYDDLLEFHFSLQHDDWSERLAPGVGQTEGK
jgi:hypothetical protein